MRRMWMIVAAALAFGQAAVAQAESALVGTWEVDTPDGKQQVIVRGDSSASFNEETVRWRLYDQKLYIAFGDEWIGYDFVLEKSTLTLSGGDLEEPIALKRVGPPKPLPKGAVVPVAPPFKPPRGRT